MLIVNPLPKIDDVQSPTHADCEMLAINPLMSVVDPPPPPTPTVKDNRLFTWTMKCGLSILHVDC